MWKFAAWMALVAVIIYQVLQEQKQTGSSASSRHNLVFRNDQEYPATPPPYQLTNEEMESFRRDGFLLKKRVISGDELEALVESGKKLYHHKSWKDIVFGSSIFYDKLSTQIWRHNSNFAQVAFESDILSVSAALMTNNNNPTTTPDHNNKMRILKDGFFAMAGQKNKGCSFHCDDKFFWPTADDTSGVNVWLTLSPISASQGGGIRVVNQSLSREFHHECLQVIQNNTCGMEETNPSCFKRMMDASVVYDMEPGDALFWDRWTFHRGEPFVEPVNDYKLRYTVRYVPENAKAQGYVHPSVQQGQLLDTPYYPQVWPVCVKAEVDAFRAGLGDDVELKPLLVLRVILRKLGLLSRIRL